MGGQMVQAGARSAFNHTLLSHATAIDSMTGHFVWFRLDCFPGNVGYSKEFLNKLCRDDDRQWHRDWSRMLLFPADQHGQDVPHYPPKNKTHIEKVMVSSSTRAP